MASMKDKLTERLGDRMRSSMGASETASPAVTPPSSPPGTSGGGPGKYDGLKAFRDARLIPIDRLVPDPDQPRKVFTDEAIDRLADSLRARGMLQPIRARWDTDLGRWVIVAGERRFRAARRAGWTEVPCVTVEGAMTDSEILQDQLIENCLREDLQPLEQAEAFKALMNANGWSARRLGEELHISHQTIGRSLALLELPETVRQKVADGMIAPRTAAEIAALDNPEAQAALAEQIASEGLTKAQVEAAVKAKKTGRATSAKHEFRFDDGNKITIIGPAVAAGADALAMLLKKALKQLHGGDQDSTRSEAA
ncbi:MAG TPA: ParB/RepB/Spo0J family partition protein [Isosphaeraceae bacterium]|nr:ParB/RepB/Spo0J family partition protein [Isosphaeraceae bacterium]